MNVVFEKESDALRRRKVNASKGLWERVAARFRRPPDPVAGIDKLPLFTTYLHTLRPWDSKPSEHYQEILRQRNYWYDNPPGLFVILFFLVILVLLNVAIAFAPFAVNWTHFKFLWRDLHKPDWIYEEAAATVFAWLLSHVCSALAPWFVYLSGGWVANKKAVLPYFFMIFAETFLTDLLFYARRLDYAYICTAVCTLAGLVGMVSMGLVTKLASGALFPAVVIQAYLTVLFYEMAQLNSTPYEPVV